jgi:ABC-type uncharacterized transport system involved in gliding motility auxiliary subunit
MGDDQMETNAMNKKSLITSYLFSSVGIAIMFVIVVAIYVISGVVRQRLDLTQEKLYTLSGGTKAILGKLDTPVEIRFYCSQSSREMPVELKAYAQQVENLVEEYRKASHGTIHVKKLDPQPDSEAEDSASLDGVEGQMMGMMNPIGGDKFYLGLAVSRLDAKVALPFLSPAREKLLEYDLSRAITQVVQPTKPVVGVMTALPVFGEMNPMMMQMGRMSRQNPWVFISELKRDFEVKQIDLNAEQIDTDIQLLLVVYPRDISEKALFAIDQYVLRGGKLIAFLDPLAFMDNRGNAMNPMQRNLSSGATLEPLLKTWGLSFDVSKVVADLSYVTHINRGTGFIPMPAVLSLTQQAVNKDDVVTGQIDSLLLPFAGVFSGTPAEGLKQTVLLKTSRDSQLVEKMLAEMSGEQITQNFVASGKEQGLAIRLAGKFKTAFPEGKPKGKEADKSENSQKDEAKQDDKDAASSLKVSKVEGVVVLVGDADMLFDQFSVQIQEVFGQRIIIPRNGNLTFVQSLVEQMGGNSNLIAVRSRATMNRPFTLVKDIQAEAAKKYQSKIKELEQNLSETQQRLSALQQQKKEAGQRLLDLSDEQKKEIENFRANERDAKRELKDLRKNLRKDIDSLEVRLKWINIAGMPLLVTLSGITLALIKRKKTAAK